MGLLIYSQKKNEYFSLMAIPSGTWTCVIAQSPTTSPSNPCRVCPPGPVTATRFIFGYSLESAPYFCKCKLRPTNLCEL